MTNAAPAAPDQQTYWNNKNGGAWVEFQDLLDRQLEPLGDLAMAALSAKTGDHLVDIGCGTGQTTLALSARVGPDGSVLGVDISRPMLEVARRRAEAQRLSQVQFTEADAQTFAFAPKTLDGVFSRFGVMFFDDPAAAFGNIRKSLKPGGRLAFVCWRAPAENLWMTPPTGSAFADLPPPPPPPLDAPGPFAFADPERVRGMLTGAGFHDVAIVAQDLPIGGNSLDDTVRLSLNIGPLGARLRERPEAHDTVVAELRKTFSNHLRDGRVYQESAVWIVTARNP